MPASANAMARKARVWRSGERNKITRNGGGEGEFSPAEGKVARAVTIEEAVMRTRSLAQSLSVTHSLLRVIASACPCCLQEDYTRASQEYARGYVPREE